MSYYSGSNTFPSLKPDFHMIRMEGTTRMIANDPGDWDDLDRLDRVEFYQDDQDDRQNFETIIWKCSQTTEMMGTIETIEGRLSQKSPLLFQ